MNAQGRLQKLELQKLDIVDFKTFEESNYKKLEEIKAI